MNSPTRLPMLYMRWALITIWIVEQILLMVLLRVIPWACGENFCDDLLALGVKVKTLNVLCYTFGDVFLLWCGEENGRAVF